MPFVHGGRKAVSAALAFAMLSCAALSHAQTLWPTERQWAQAREPSASVPAWRSAVTAQRRIAEDAMKSEPRPVAVLTTGGRLRGDALKAQTEAGLQDMAKIQALAITYRLDRDPRHAAKAGEYLLRWSQANHPSGQPIDETGLEPAIFGYRMVRGDLGAATRESIDGWMRRIAEAEMGSREMKKKTATNNWHSHRLKIVGLIGFALGDARMIAYARDGLRAQINDNLLASGESVDFQERDALSYHVYDLRPLVTLALAFAEQGEDFYHWKAANGASIAHSVAWLMPYLKGEKTHAEFVRSDVRFDKARSDNGERGHVVGSLYEPRDALPLLVLAAAYDPECAALAQRLSGGRANWRLAFNLLPAAARTTGG
ncbi:alginate lyase family protein [Acidovorax sp. NCPPB 3576]|uniref:alginate lyase family protein n=1 Tax=Acidovorax sp. NCPPB 3576 TaxID=2940488 RepID=UPI002349AD66|nr:alginate lyase family protein [Acidovorax sp. NCPPB 3576]WCM86726.1 alginate lyase family protein [Acidovorax sp. NCPPB 3576]